MAANAKPTRSRSRPTKSAWTPTTHVPSNEQLFEERKALVGHWFDMWTDSQRRRFFDFLLRRSSAGQARYVHDLLHDRVPVRRADFTRILPRFLSLYIFSFLDPRTLSRCALVSWHWKFLSEQDSVWTVKCVRHGWYLPYAPSEREYGAWKFHYINCVQTLDMTSPSKEMAHLLASFSATDLKSDVDSESNRKLRRSRKGLSWKKPPWLDPDPRPEDLERGWRAIQTGSFDRAISGSSPVHFFTHSAASKTYAQAAALTLRHGLSLSPPPSARRRRNTDPDVENGTFVGDRRPASAIPLSMSFDASNGTSGGPTLSSSFVLATQLKHDVRGGFYPTINGTKDARALEQGYPSYSHPAVLIISSQTPAYELLLDALLFGVLPIMYEHDSTTLDALLFKLKIALSGRHAKNIGLLMNGDSTTVNVVAGHTMSASSMQTDEALRGFWEEMCGHLLTPDQGGRLDFFAPLASTEEGRAILQYIEGFTGTKLSAPSRISPTYKSINSEWWGLGGFDLLKPPAVYFDVNKLNAWANMAEQVDEALACVKKTFRFYFTKKQKELAGRLAGQAVFEALGLVDVQQHFDHLLEISSLLIEGISDVPSYSSREDATLHLSSYLRDHGLPTETGAEPSIDSKEESIEEISIEEDEPEVRRFAASSVEGRGAIADEFYRTEVTYMRTLSVIHTVFVVPLKAAIDSNKPVVSAINLRMMVSDVEAVLVLSRLLIDDLKSRLDTWTADQCIGDVLLKFASQLKVYTNYVNNYSVTLSTIEKCEEEIPAFKAFLRKRERKPESMMLSLIELLLIPTKRIEQYLYLLEELKNSTPKDHPDRPDVIAATKAIQQVQNHIKETKEHHRKDRRMAELEKRIVDCPGLIEGNRRLIAETEVTQMKSVGETNGSNSSNGGYQPIQDLGLFLFSDALLVTVLKTKHFPLERSFSQTHHYLASVALSNLQFSSLPDSKYMQNACLLKTPKHRWIFQLQSAEEKISWLSLLESTVHASISHGK
ncbi:epithelial cell-transforming sequence 2 oncogene-like isoform X2 [Oscarella lobularis]|uniref:epithelial cell-transforming sequence 2 oncogene-like isoform X2 n=1 Tax=Oscarella lobularis TaxID=121494 RepID=UPI003313ABDC